MKVMNVILSNGNCMMYRYHFKTVFPNNEGNECSVLAFSPMSEMTPVSLYPNHIITALLGTGSNTEIQLLSTSQLETIFML